MVVVSFSLYARQVSAATTVRVSYPLLCSLFFLQSSIPPCFLYDPTDSLSLATVALVKRYTRSPYAASSVASVDCYQSLVSLSHSFSLLVLLILVTPALSSLLLSVSSCRRFANEWIPPARRARCFPSKREEVFACPSLYKFADLRSLSLSHAPNMSKYASLPDIVSCAPSSRSPGSTV